MDKVFLIKTISLYLAIISLISTIVFLVLNFIKSERVKVSLNKANKKEVLKLDDEDWTKNIIQNNPVQGTENLPSKKETKELKKDIGIKAKSDKFELKDL